MDDDCEDQALCPTKVCTKFECQWWEGDVRHRPVLELRGKFWCCPKCHSSYGERPHPDLDETERCIACDVPLQAGDEVYSDLSGGYIHAKCCGPERESYTGADGEPLKAGEPIPKPRKWAA